MLLCTLSVHAIEFVDAFNHHEAVRALISEQGRVCRVLLLRSILIDHLLIVHLACTNFIIILRGVPCALVDQVEEKVHAVEAIALALNQGQLGWATRDLARNNRIMDQPECSCELLACLIDTLRGR